jgi:predicted MFS family arabinose efflux permease
MVCSPTKTGFRETLFARQPCLFPMPNDRGLVYRYYAFQATNAAGFFVPVTTVVLLDKGFDLSFVLLSYAVLSLASVASEIPTGYVGDRLGRRGSLAAATVGRVGVYLAYPFAESAAAFLALHVAWAAARAFRSGTADAWLYELLDERFDSDEFAAVRSKGSSLLLATSAVTAVAGSVLYTLDPAFPFVANAALATLALPLLWTFPTVGGGVEVFTVGEAASVLRAQVGRPEVRWLVAYAALFSGLFAVTKTYEQPALEAVGVPVAGLGVLYAGFKLVSAGAAATAGPLQDKLGARGVFALLPVVLGAAYAAILVVPEAAVLALFLNRGSRVATRPIRNQYLNDRLGDVGRATVLSGAAMVLAVGSGVARTVTAVAASGGPLAVLPAAGLVVAGLAALLWVAASPVRSESVADAGSAAAAD